MGLAYKPDIDDVRESPSFEIISQLREAGCVLLGKLNLHELALGLTTHSSLGGQTLDPYDLARAPGGSSVSTDTFSPDAGSITASSVGPPSNIGP